jgi:hypothetical protein
MKAESTNRMKYFIAELKRVVFQPTRYAMMKRWMKEMFACNRHHAPLSADIPFGSLVVAGIDLIGRQGQYFRQ